VTRPGSNGTDHRPANRRPPRRRTPGRDVRKPAMRRRSSILGRHGRKPTVMQSLTIDWVASRINAPVRLAGTGCPSKDGSCVSSPSDPTCAGVGNRTAIVVLAIFVMRSLFGSLHLAFGAARRSSWRSRWSGNGRGFRPRHYRCHPGCDLEAGADPGTIHTHPALHRISPASTES